MRAAHGYEDFMHARRADGDAATRLSRIELCASCQGHRLEKVVYNGSLVLERTCSHCDGEGVVTRVASAATQQQQQQQKETAATTSA